MPSMQADIAQIINRAEAILGYHFTDKALLQQALTHSSATENEPEKNYERLEFLGDALVSYLIAELAFTRYPDLREGELTKMRVAVVNGEFLSEVMDELGFAHLIIFGASELSSKARGLHSALEDVYESVSGALYLDGGLAVAQRWVDRTLSPFLCPEVAQRAANPKSELQEIMQEKGSAVSYSIVASTGPAHAPHFTAAALVDGVEAARAEGCSKKEAESAAAALVLKRILQ